VDWYLEGQEREVQDTEDLKDEKSLMGKAGKASKKLIRVSLRSRGVVARY
jgi:ferritin